MATWAERFDQYRTQEIARKRAESERNMLAEILRGAYEAPQAAQPAQPFVDEQAQFMGAESPRGLVSSEAVPGRAGGLNVQNALAGLLKAGRLPEAMQLQSMMKTSPDQWEKVDGPRGTILQRNKTTGEMKSVIGTPERTPDWMMPGYIETQREIARARVEGKPAKLPTPALKMQQEELDAIGTSANISTDIDAIKNQVDSGQLKLGLATNLLSKGRNIAGMSDETSRNFATFQATLEKLRNDSLRLNKGVQTEGDAVRAWNELIANINDPQLVSKRLEEIKRINERATNIRKLNIENIRQNFGLDPLDVGGYENPKTAIVPALRPGTIEDGYIFLGGDPRDKTRWKKK